MDSAHGGTDERGAGTTGASPRKIEELETRLGGSVPASYRRYLLAMGKDDAGPLRGTDCLLRHVVANNEWLPRLLSENDVHHDLPERYVCFFMHQGYIAAWFDLDSPGGDPPCWVFSEYDVPVPELRGTFSSFMRAEVEARGGTWEAG